MTEQPEMIVSESPNSSIENLAEAQWRSAALFAQLIAGRWTLPVLKALSTEGRRYQELHDALDGVSYKVLTEALRRAERDGLITRRLDGGRIETATLYELTETGRSLVIPLAALGNWVDNRWESVQAAREQWDSLRRSKR